MARILRRQDLRRPVIRRRRQALVPSFHHRRRGRPPGLLGKLRDICDLADHVVLTSRHERDSLAALGVAGSHYSVIPIGTDPVQIGDYLERLAAGEAVMEMHVVLQHHLFALFATCGMTVRDMLFDEGAGGDFLSASFLLQKTG